MPIYEYECKNCGTRFEKLQPVTADPVKTCPNCEQESVRRVIHPAGIIFKGSGWYITDTRKAPPSEGASDSSGGADKPADAKPAAPADKGTPAKESAS